MSTMCWTCALYTPVLHSTPLLQYNPAKAKAKAKATSTMTPPQPDGSLRKLMDSTRLNALGWKAKINLEQGLALAYQDFKHKISL